ncbi:MAG: acetate kinase [Verrucomicrobia bacterium]|nr:acetate kinase [Verrucomicrobiota bacterium]
MKILVANLGSTSLKWRLFEFAAGQERLLHKGGFERVTDYTQAIEGCLAQLVSSGAIAQESDLAAVGFKTVLARGLTGCVRLDEAALAAMEACNQIAPAHNPPYVNGIRRFAEKLPGKPLVGLFETAFFQWAPEAAMRYAVPENWHTAGVRRWGYHGASHKFIAERSAELLGRPDVARRAQNLYLDAGATPVDSPDLRVISCHLGGSSSITGIRNGVAVGNSLGLSPQSGLPHNNRVGDLDPFALPFLMRATGLSLDEAERQMCRDSGLKGLSGVSNDVRDILAAAAQGHPRARLALDVFIHEIRRWLGAYWVQLGGVEAVVFTAGIGENQTELRAAICAGLEDLGLTLDPDRNGSVKATEAVISRPDSRVQALVIPTNEELVVARETYRLLQAQPAST